MRHGFARLYSKLVEVLRRNEGVNLANLYPLLKPGATVHMLSRSERLSKGSYSDCPRN